MSEQVEVTTHQQKQVAAIVTLYVNFGGQIAWLPRRINSTQVMRKCVSYVSVEENEDFEKPAKDEMAKREPAFSAEAMKWVKECVRF